MLIDFHTHCFPDKLAPRAIEKLSFMGGGLEPYTDGTVATLPVRYGSHIGNASPKKTVGNSEFTQLLHGALPISYGKGYAWRTVYEDPHPDKTLSAVRYVAAAGKEEVAVSFFGITRGASRDITASVAPCSDTTFSDGVAGVQE